MSPQKTNTMKHTGPHASWHRYAACVLLLTAATTPCVAEAKTAIGVVVPWYGNGDADGWHNWELAGHDPDQYINGQHDIASAHYPLMGPYKSRDDATENWQLGYAEAMGMDVLLIDYYTQNLPGKSIYYDYTINMLDKAAGGGLQLAMQYEPKIHTENWVQDYNGDRVAMTNAVIDDLRHVYDVLATKPAYWHVDNKPVLKIFGQAWTLTALEWADVVSTLDTEGREFYYMGGSVAGPNLANWYPQFQSHLNWSLYGPEVEGEQGWSANYGFTSQVNNLSLNWAAAGAGRQSVGIAWPGFDDSGVDGWGGDVRYISRDDGAFYQASLQTLNDQNHEWRVFATINDWNEGTELEPSVEYGYQYAIDTQNHIEAWKGIVLDDNAMRDVTETYFPQLAIPVILSDPADNLGMLHSYDSVAIDTSNAQFFEDDGARFYRAGSMTASYIQYLMTEDLGGFSVPTWFVSSEPVVDMLFFTSADGINWTEHAPMATDQGGDAWTRILYENDGVLPAGHRYLRIQWPVTAGHWWSSQIGEVQLFGVDVDLLGDLDGDGFVGINDLNIVLSNWNLAVPPGDVSADPSGDGFVGIDDLNVVLGNWNAGASAPTVHVPEASGLGLLVVGGALLLTRRSSSGSSRLSHAQTIRL